MDKIKDKLTFSKIEVLFIIVMLALVILAGIIAVSITTRNKNISNFKDDSSFLLSIASNAYASFDMSEKAKYITTSVDGSSKGLCFTLKGLRANNLLTEKMYNETYKDWDAYVVIEESSSKKYNYTIWATNGKYVIDGYDSTKIKELTTDNGLTSYNDDSFTTKVKTSFTGTSSAKGGTGNTDGTNLKRYENACINEKVE